MPLYSYGIIFSYKSRREKNMKIQVFLITPPERSHNSNLILGVIFPPKSGARLKRYQLLQSFKPNCELQQCVWERAGASGTDLFFCRSQPDPTHPWAKMTYVLSKAKLPQIIYYIWYMIYYILYIIYYILYIIYYILYMRY